MFSSTVPTLPVQVASELTLQFSVVFGVLVLVLVLVLEASSTWESTWCTKHHSQGGKVNSRTKESKVIDELRQSDEVFSF